MKDELYTKINMNLYYFLIGFLSLLVLFVAPLFTLGEKSELVFQLPRTAAAWMVYTITKVFVAIINLLLFHCFVKQARLNIRDNDNYKKATEILQKYKPKEYKPRSEKQYFGKLYLTKGTTIFITSILGAVVLTNAILSWDLSSFITYALTIIMGIVFGIMKMKDVEHYWTGEFYDYAVLMEKQSDSNQPEQCKEE